MAFVTINDQHLKDIAEAIREKNGTDKRYKPREMGLAIESLPTGNNGENLLQGTLKGDYYNSRVTYLAAGFEYQHFGPGQDVENPINTELTSITFPNVRTIEEGFVFGGDAIEKVDLGSATNIGGRVEFGDNLTAVVLRSGHVCEFGVDHSDTTGHRMPFGVSPILPMNKTVTERGYIYVPDALREEYEAKYADMWQVFNVSESRKDNFMYKFRSIEEWPDICHNPDFV